MDILVIKIKEAYFGIETPYVRSVIQNPPWSTNKPFSNFRNDSATYNGRKIFLVHSLNENDKEYRWLSFVEVSLDKNEYVIPVHEIVNIFRVSENTIMPIPPFAKRHLSKNFFTGVICVDSKLLLMLDISKFSMNGGNATL